MKVISELLVLEKTGQYQEALDIIRCISHDTTINIPICSLNLKLLEQRLIRRLQSSKNKGECDSGEIKRDPIIFCAKQTTDQPTFVASIDEKSTSNSQLASSFRLSRLMPDHDGWTREFSHGSIVCTDEGVDSVTTMRVEGGRDYLSRTIELKPNHEYILSIECTGMSGNPRDVLAIFCSEDLKGNTALNANFINECGCYSIVFNTGDSATSARIRVGVGVTAPCESAAEIHIKHLDIAFQKCSANNRNFLSEGLHKYIDPELILPPLIGLGNNYDFIQSKCGEIIQQSVWEKLKVSVIISYSGCPETINHTLASICKQTYPRGLIEVVIVDYSSQDCFDDIFLKYNQELMLYWAKIKQDTLNLARINNLGVRASQNEVLLFLKESNFLSPEYIRDLMLYYHTGYNLCVISDDVALDACRKDIINFNDGGLISLSDTPFLYFCSSKSSVSRESFIRVGGFDESLSDQRDMDQELAYRLFMNGAYFITLHMPFHSRNTGINRENSQDNSADINSLYSLQIQERCPHLSIRNYEQVQNFDEPMVSVYVPAYNASRYILQAIRSVLNQTYTDYEIVIVDDGSTDTTWDVLNDNFSNNPKIRLYRKENGGIGSASNYAIKHCRGYLIVQLDSDDMLTPNALATVTEFLGKNPQLDCVYSKFDLVHENGTFYKSGWAPPDYDRYEALVGMNIPHMRCFKRSLYSRTSGFDETIENAVDYDFYLKLSRVARIAHLSEKLYLYRMHECQTSTAKRGVQARNHVIVVTNFLHSLGHDSFIVEKLDPTELHANYIYKKDGFFSVTVKNRIYRQDSLPEGIEPKTPLVVGNDYTYIQNYVRSFYENNPKNYFQKVSIIVPVYNRAERLSRCLAGLYHQTYPRNLIEIVVVDDGSSDNVIEVINKYRGIFDLKYVKQADEGYRLSAARNLGIRTATHQNISIVDCDLIPLPNFIESFMQYLHHFDKVVLLGHQRFVDPTGVTDDDILANVKVLEQFKDIVAENTTMKVSGKDEGPTRDWRYSLYEETNYLKHDEYPYRAFSSGHVAYRRVAIEQAGYYDEEFNVWGCEDNETGYRLYNQGYIFIPVLDAIDLHQEPPSGKNETDRESDRIISRELLKAKCPAVRGWFGTPYTIKSNDTPLVSICIPVFNTVEYITEAIESALAQSIQDIEIVVYDDCSSDGTFELVRETYKRNHRVRLINGTERRNVTFARNELLKVARGEFVGFLDSDDMLEPTCIEDCLKEFRGKPNVGLICTGYSKIDEMGKSLGIGWTPKNFTREGMYFGNIFTHFRIFRIRDWNRSAKWSDHELANIIYGEDWDLCLKLTEVTEFSRIDKPLYRYRVRSSSITRSNRNQVLADQTLSIAKGLLKRLGLLDVGVGSSYPESKPHLVYYYKYF